jgi:hypothetical protein
MDFRTSNRCSIPARIVRAAALRWSGRRQRWLELAENHSHKHWGRVRGVVVACGRHVLAGLEPARKIIRLSPIRPGPVV